MPKGRRGSPVRGVATSIMVGSTTRDRINAFRDAGGFDSQDAALNALVDLYQAEPGALLRSRIAQLQRQLAEIDGKNGSRSAPTSRLSDVVPTREFVGAA